MEKLEQIEFNDIEFTGGKVVRNKEINRIQFLFNSKPSEEIRSTLKSNGFHWSRQENAWQRLFNENAIIVTNRIVENVLTKQNKQEDEEEFE